MLDDEYLPQCHPLRKYLTDLKLDDTDFVSPSKPTFFSALGMSVPMVPWSRLVTVTNLAACVTPYVFCFAEHCRLRLFCSILALFPRADEECAVYHQFYSSHASGCTWKPVLLVSIIYLVSFLGLKVCAFGVLWTLSFICFMIGSFSMCTALCIFSVDCIIRFLSKAFCKMQAHRRSCVTFIQEFEFHSTFGSSSSEIRAPSRLQRGITECLRICAFEFVGLSCAFVSFPVSEEFEAGLSVTQLDSLKESLTSASVNDASLSSHRKMFREVAVLLESDLFDKIAGVIFSIRIHRLGSWFRAAWLLCQCVLVVRSLESRFYRLDQLRIALEHGIDDSDKSEAPRILRHSPTCHSNNTPARNLLMHLLVAVSDVRELTSIYERSTDSSHPDALSVIKRIRLQLDACGTFCDVLEHFLTQTQLDTQANCDVGVDSKGAAPSLCLSSQSSEHIMLEPIDPEPEDDLLEDVAIGVVPEDATDETAYIQTDFGTQTTVPLHSSVLRELRLAIACRRVEMEDREQRAWEKRLKSRLTRVSGLASSKQVMGTPTRLEPTLSTGLSTLSQVNNTVPKFSSIDIKDADLRGFFSSALTEPNPKLVAFQQTLRTQCPWRAQSAVRKRMRRLPHFVPTRCVRDTRVVISNDIESNNLPFTIPRNCPVVDSSLAAALLSQRRKIGYAEEELFTDFGEGDDAPQSEPILRHRNVVPLTDA